MEESPKKEIKVYLAHYDTTRFFERQVHLIRKYFKYNHDTTVMKLYGFVDSETNETSEIMRRKWMELDVIPIDLPRGRVAKNSVPHGMMGFSVSYGLAFQYIYDNYIKHNTYRSVFLENDMFPIDYIDIEEYSKGYKICGDVRFNAGNLPDRIIMFYLGLQIFNHEYMTEKEMYSGRCGYIKALSGNMYATDCGGESYYWLQHNENYKTIRHIPTIGCINPNYDPFNSLICEVHNITTDTEHLPELLRTGYNPSFRVVNYDNLFLHLELMGHDYDNDHIKYTKNEWFNNIYRLLMEK
jgi:hypothetical protein